MQYHKTIYVGNLSKNLREEFLWFLFSKIGRIKRIIIGINKKSLLPCGFCFIEYFFIMDCRITQQTLFGLEIKGKFIKLDKDDGYKENRHFSLKSIL
mmetsp:Transcript_24838/g.56067  ORF Transcript_24838/g.56067 Transcript_24838/m.56067 type:complete len:97 (+) Transcript_24838:1-291(+)